MSKLLVEKGNKIYFHPAYHLKDILNYEPNKKKRLAKYLDSATIESFLEGNLPVDEKIANALERSKCGSKQFWFNLQKAWEKRLTK